MYSGFLQHWQLPSALLIAAATTVWPCMPACGAILNYIFLPVSTRLAVEG